MEAALQFLNQPELGDSLQSTSIALVGHPLPLDFPLHSETSPAGCKVPLMQRSSDDQSILDHLSFQSRAPCVAVPADLSAWPSCARLRLTASD